MFSEDAAAGLPARVSEVDPLVRGVAWSAMLLSSALPEIFFGHSRQEGPSWLPVSQCAILLILALFASRIDRLRGLVRFIIALAALWLAWYVIAPAVMTMPPVHAWMESSPWGERLLVARLLPVAGAFLMGLTLIGSGIRREDLFLRVGQLNAPAKPEAVLGIRRPIRWTKFGPFWLAVFGIALPLFLSLSLRPNFSFSGRILHFLPWIFLVAALNAANEEFQFRCVPLAHLRSILPAGEAVALTAIFFGIGHYYGQPSGPVGVVMAAFAGWIWGKSMIETRGAGWAFTIHMVQDIVIFCFLVLGDKPRL